MTDKRKLNDNSYEVGETSHCRRSRRLSQLIESVTHNTVPTSNYFDNGDCEYICEHCGALFGLLKELYVKSYHLKYNHCCKGGAVRLPFPLEPPAAIKQLFADAIFMENIRAYNNMFFMTSFGAQIDDTINDGRGPYVFKVSGQVSHWIGSLCPPHDETPRFLQLYIYNTINEISNRLRFFSSSDNRKLSEHVVRCLSDTLNSFNEYARLFKNATEMCNTTEDCDFSVRLYNNVGDRRYEPPAPGTLGGIVRADNLSASNYDIIIHKKDGTPQRVNKLHSSYIPLQYPLLFPFAEQGWSPDLKLRSSSN